LRFDFSIPVSYLSQLRFAIPVWIIAKVISFRLCGLDRGWWRYVALPDIFRIAAGNLIGSFVAGVVIASFSPAGFPRSLYVLDFMICLLATASIRLATRMVYEAGSQWKPSLGMRTLIYGAGKSGQALVREIRSNNHLRYTVCGFVDDDPNKNDAILNGVKVLGNGAQLASLVRRLQVQEVLIACPDASGDDLVRILRLCRSAEVRCKTIPGMADLIDKRGLMAQIRPIEVEDLLGRKPVRLEETRISSRLDGKAVVVTGAAGSIGSELCRQIARFHPKALVALEVAETALFHLEREMKSSFPELRFFGEIGNVQDSCRVSEVFDKYQPSIVYHAAAYKHVPVMESHIFQAVENNVLGTWNVARQAEMHGVSHLVLISSDKAVQPVNVMGLTKRVAEIVINSMPRINASSLSVRFGNVLGSNGSVIPLFQDQISRGGPVTVTHPDMERYFMTIPEAAQLVLQASAMGKGSEIFVLDMGQRVKIVDLATNMILLYGLEPEKDIRIQFSGVRPGEKLYEELSAYEEGTAPTDHEKIKVFCGVGRPWNEVEARLNGIRTSCETRDIQELVILLRDLVPEYTPSTFVLEQVATSLQPAAKVLTGKH
jgi:FlaA1/EpsC-like NDP-sugar epimerase